jgi:bacillolysin
MKKGFEMLKKALPLAVMAALGTAYVSYSVSTQGLQTDLAITNPVIQKNSTSNDLNNTPISIPADSPEAGIPLVLEAMKQQTNNRLSTSTPSLLQSRAFFSKPKSSLKRGENVFFTGSPKNPLHAITADDAKNIIMQGGKNYLNASPGDDLALMTSKRDKLGNVIYKYSQTYEDLIVFGRELVVQINSDDEIAMIGGQYEPAINLTTTPLLSATDAFNNAFQYFKDLPNDTPKLLTEPELMVYADGKNEPVLAYIADTEYTAKSGYKKEKIFVDANTGLLVNSFTLVHSAFNYSIHTANNNCLSQNGSGLPGTEITKDDGAHAAGVDANSAHAYYFYKHMFNRDSWDDNGRKIVSTIHARFQGSNGQCGSDNAFFEGSQFVFGDGTTNLINPGAAIDIFGHEFTHGFTSSESNLTYQDQSGAINEAMSDIMGTGVSIWKNSGGTPSGNPSSFTPTDIDWDMGEDAAQTQSWERHMDDPAENGQSIDNYPDRNTGSEDSGGVHTNSGIMDLAFYLLSEGGDHPRDKTSNVVSGVGVEKALQIYYYANDKLFTSSTNFQDARGKLATAAKTLYGCDEWESVHQSYDAVNVPGTRSDECETDGGGTGGGGTGGGGTGGGGTGGGGTTTPPPSGNNIAIGSAYNASSVYNSWFSPSNSTDGSDSTFWVSRNIYNSYAEEYVMMNLGGDKSFSSLNIDWGGSDAAGSIAVWVWDWSRGWTMVGSKNGAPATGVSFSTQQAQYVMVTMKNGWYRRWYAISEITIQ